MRDGSCLFGAFLLRQKVVLEQSVPRRPPATLRRTHMVRAKKNKKMTAVATPTDLKRLAFVESAAVSSYEYLTGSAYFAKACGYYSNAKETNALKVRRPPRRVERRASRAATRDPAVGTADLAQDRDSFRRFARAPNPDTLRRAPRVAAPAGRITRSSVSGPRNVRSPSLFLPSVDHRAPSPRSRTSSRRTACPWWPRSRRSTPRT